MWIRKRARLFQDAAACLGEEREGGAVAYGLRADLVLLDGYPLTDIGNAAKIAGVMLQGRWLPRSELDRMLREVERLVVATR